MTSFNTIPNLPDVAFNANSRGNLAGASANGLLQPAASKNAPESPAVSVAQRIARKSVESLPETSRLLESIVSDSAQIESVRNAAVSLQKAAEKAPAFDPAGVSAALATIEFALKQGREFAEKLKQNLPALEQFEGASLNAFAANPAAFSKISSQLGRQADASIKRMAALAEELGARNQRIAARQEQPSVEAFTAALQSQGKRGLATSSMPPGGQSQVSSLLSDLGLARSAGQSSGPVMSPAAQSVSTLMSRLQKQFPDAG